MPTRRKKPRKLLPPRRRIARGPDTPPASIRTLTRDELVLREPDTVRDALAQGSTPSGRSGLQAFVDELLAAVDYGQPTALRTYAKILRLVGAEVQIVQQFIRTVGATPERARTGVTLLDRVEGLEAEDVAAIVEPFLRDFYRLRGKKLVVIDDLKQEQA